MADVPAPPSEPTVPAVPPPVPPRRKPRLEFVLPPVFLALFVFLADGVAHHRGLTALDEHLADTVRTLNGSLDVPAWHAVKGAMARLTYLGSFWTVFVLSVLVAAVLAWQHQWRLLAIWLAAQVLNGISIEVLKALFARPRPRWAVEHHLAHGFSFPSGHSAGSAAVYGLLAYLLARQWPATLSRGIITAVVTCLVLTVGYSRLYLGVHYLGDVLAGYCVGLTWVCVAVIAIEWRRPR